MDDPTVPASLVRGLFEFALSRGASRKELAKIAGVGVEALQDPDERIPFATYVALMRTAKELTRDPALALHFGESVDFSELTIAGMAGKPSGTLENDITEFNRYAKLALDVSGQRFRIARADGDLWVIDTRPNPNDFPEFTEAVFARAVSSMRRRFGDLTIIKSLRVTHPEPPYRAEYDRIFRVPVTFDSDMNAAAVSEEYWPMIVRAHPSGVAANVITAHADSLLEKLESSKSTRGRVEELLMPILHTGTASIGNVASKLGLSRQTLFRRLKAEGVTFEQVLDGLRRRKALHYLQEKKMSVTETAYRVGFSDPAAFSRAFKRWTGSSPGNRRRK